MLNPDQQAADLKMGSSMNPENFVEILACCRRV